jgi:hypothetical protein
LCLGLHGSSINVRRYHTHFAEKSAKSHRTASNTKKTYKCTAPPYAFCRKMPKTPRDSVENEKNVQMRRGTIRILPKSVPKTSRQRQKPKKRINALRYRTYRLGYDLGPHSRLLLREPVPRVGRGHFHNVSICRLLIPLERGVLIGNVVILAGAARVPDVSLRAQKNDFA